MTDQTESDIHSPFNACMFREHCRALEAKVRELEEPTLCEECGKSIHDCNMDYWERKAKKAMDDYAELRADRDRLAGEVERLERNLTDVSGLHVLAMDRCNQAIARLTGELAAARGNEARYLWLRDSARGRSLSVSALEWSRDAVLADAAIDAARRAGGEG